MTSTASPISQELSDLIHIDTVWVSPYRYLGIRYPTPDSGGDDTEDQSCTRRGDTLARLRDQLLRDDPSLTQLSGCPVQGFTSRWSRLQQGLSVVPQQCPSDV